MSNELMFVYGTLKKAYGNNRLLEGAEFLGEAVTLFHDYHMVSRGIPMVYQLPTGKGFHVGGELYSVPDALVPNIDRLEGHPRWYRRELIDVLTPNTTQATQAWMYIMQGEVRDHNSDDSLMIEGGVYYWNR